MKLAFPATRAASRTIGCDPSLAWDILSDYVNWPEWLPLVTKATQMARETNFALLELELTAFPGRKVTKVTAECVHAPNAKVLVKSIMGQDPEFVLDWTVAPAGTGQALVSVKCTWVHTPGTIVAARSALNPDLWLNALAAQAASFADDVTTAGDMTTGPTDPATLLEIYETDAGLICWYRGKKYQMTAVS